VIRAGGYVLIVPPERVETLLAHASIDRSIGEPVPVFPGSRRAALLVIASFSAGHITHIADGRKGVASGTRLVRLNLSDLEQLTAPVPIWRLLEMLPPRSRTPVLRRFERGGPLSPVAFRALVAALGQLAPDIAPRLGRFTGERDQVVAKLSDTARNALAEQKEGVALAMRISGLDTRELLDWTPPAEGTPSSFLAGLPGAVVREDAMVVHDLGTVPGFAAVQDLPFAAKLFEKDGTRLTVVLANKLPLEEQFGADLIYYNETYRSFVMVQYKAMERGGDGKAHFRLPNAQLELEIGRMDATSAALSAISDDPSRESFRLHASPFILKLCARHTFNPDDAGLFPGMYLPLDYWRRLIVDPATVGPRGGRLVTYENVGRKLAESEFVALVAGGWIGTGAAQSAVLEDVIRDIVQNGKAVVLAVRSQGSPASY